LNSSLLRVIRKCNCKKYILVLFLRQVRRIANDRKRSAAVKATIWHNPGCGTSRKTLAILEGANAQVTVIEYKKTPFTRAKLEQLFKDAGLTAAQALRIRGTDAEALGLTNTTATADQILNAMAADAMLVERPFVETDKGVRLCRPQDKVREIL
jgi:arsenate reductase (glutaredoxin)